MEVLAKRKTSRALVLLLGAQPHRALLVEPGGKASTVSPALGTKESALESGDTAGGGGHSYQRSRERGIEAALVQPGDVLRVVPGAQVRLGLGLGLGLGLRFRVCCV